MNKVKNQGVKIMLDKERTMLFDLNALCVLEESYESVFDAFEEIEKMRMKSIRSILHASLVHEDESLTLIGVGKLINLDNIEEISTKLTNALLNSSPEVDEADKSVSKTKN